MTYPFTRVFLALSGAIGAIIGLSIMFIPHAFYASNHVTLGTDPNLMSEIRAPAGWLILAGAIMFCGAARRRHSKTALLIGALVFGSYGVSRLVSLFLDGIPSAALIGALVIELVVGFTAAVLAIRSDVIAPPH